MYKCLTEPRRGTLSVVQFLISILKELTDEDSFILFGIRSQIFDPIYKWCSVPLKTVFGLLRSKSDICLIS